MFAPDIRFEGFSAADWQRFLTLFQPASADLVKDAKPRPRGTIVAIHDHGRLRKLLHTQVGRLRLDDAKRDWPLSAAELASRHDTSSALCIQSGALEHIMETLGALIQRHDDFTTQTLSLLTLLRQQIELGRIDLWPKPLADVPTPTHGMVEGSIDLVCPKGKTMLLGLFHGGTLWTSIALKRGSKGIELVLGPHDLRAEVGLLSGDMRRDHRHLARAVADRCGPLSLACFSEYTTFRSLEVDPTPGAWALAVAVRDVVLHPVPAAMAIPLGIDAGRAAFSALRSVTSRIDPAGIFNPAWTAIVDVASGARKAEDAFGFNPLEILRRLLSRDE